jgi:hypothetical protein
VTPWLIAQLIAQNRLHNECFCIHQAGLASQGSNEGPMLFDLYFEYIILWKCAYSQSARLWRIDSFRGCGKTAWRQVA